MNDRANVRASNQQLNHLDITPIRIKTSPLAGRLVKGAAQTNAAKANAWNTLLGAALMRNTTGL
jgi:hypothetical protein